MEAEGNKPGDGWTHANEDRAKRGRNVFARVPLAEKFKRFKKMSSKSCTNKKYKVIADKYGKHKVFEVWDEIMIFLKKKRIPTGK